jgi:hypothetical protein
MEMRHEPTMVSRSAVRAMPTAMAALPAAGVLTADAALVSWR